MIQTCKARFNCAMRSKFKMRTSFEIGFIASLTLIVHLCKSMQISDMMGLQERLEAFAISNIRITAQFAYWKYQPLSVPVVLLDTVYRQKISFLMKTWFTRNYKVNVETPYLQTYKSPFKYRETLCILDLILHLGDETFNHGKYLLGWYSNFEYIEDKYVVVIRQHSAFLAEEQQKIWSEQLSIRGLDIKRLRVFVWTVVKDFNLTTKVHRLYFQSTFFRCKTCDKQQLNCTVFMSPALELNPESFPFESKDSNGHLCQQNTNKIVLEITPCAKLQKIKLPN